MVSSFPDSVCVSVPVAAGRRRTPWALRSALLAASLLTAQAAQAEPAAQTARPDPLDAQASVPTLRYESSFSQYRRLGDDKPVSWRDANDTVARIGGWRVYAREAQQPDLAPATKPADAAPAVKPLTAGHGGHQKP